MAQRHKRVTVNVTGCKFVSFEENIIIIIYTNISALAGGTWEPSVKTLYSPLGHFLSIS